MNPAMTKGIISLCFALFLLIGGVRACQPFPAKQMEVIRERFRSAVFLFPPPALQNLTNAQARALNQTIDDLLRVNDKPLLSDVDRENLRRAVQAYAEQISHG
jgi:hypothetical protein